MANESHPNDDARFVNTFLSLALSIGGGWIPGTDCFGARVYAKCMGVTDASVRSYVKKFKIPYRQPGNEMFIGAADFIRHLPFFNQEE